MALTLPKVRTKVGAVDDDDPNATEPTTGVVDLGTTNKRIVGYLQFQTPPDTADIEFWAKNEHPDVASADAWIFSGRLAAWPNIEMFEHISVVGMKVYMRLVNISGGNVDIFAGLAKTG